MAEFQYHIAQKDALKRAAVEVERLDAQIGALVRKNNTEIRNAKARIYKVMKNKKLLRRLAMTSGGLQSLQFRLDELTRRQAEFNNKMMLVKVNEEVRQITYATTVTLNQICNVAVLASAESANRVVSKFAKDMKRRANRRSGLLTVHREVGALAQEAIIKSYLAQTVDSEPYRVGQGRLSGQLLPALKRNDLVRAFPDGLAIGNEVILDHAAKHWRRINYGTLPHAQKSPGSFPITIGGVQVSTLSDLHPPSAAFNMPFGMWRENPLQPGAPVKFGPSNKDHGFFPLKWSALARGDQAAIKTRVKRQRGFRFRGVGPPVFFGGNQRWFRTGGIRGQRFFDAGLRVVARELPLRYELKAKKWFEESVAAGLDVDVEIL